MVPLFELFYEKIGGHILKYFLLFIQNVYKGNLSLLLSIIERDSDLTEQLSENFGAVFSQDFDKGLKTVQTMFNFTFYDSTDIMQNLKFITEIIREENYELKEQNKTSVTDINTVYVGTFFDRSLYELVNRSEFKPVPINEYSINFENVEQKIVRIP